jgi:hypothetical protein
MKKNKLTDVWAKINVGFNDQCWEWLGHTNNSGYGSMQVNGIIYSAHRIIYYLSYPEKITLAAPKDKKVKEFILHKCDNRKCCNPNHMSLGNYDDNNKDAKAKGRSNAPKGSNHKLAKLTEDQADQARFFHGHGWSYAEIGRMFGIHGNNISRICKYKGYKGAVNA